MLTKKTEIPRFSQLSLENTVTHGAPFLTTSVFSTGRLVLVIFGVKLPGKRSGVNNIWPAVYPQLPRVFD